MISCKDLLNLDIFNYITLIAGESGIYKNVTWTYICQTLDFSKWVNGGELLFITGMGMDLEESSLTKLIRDCADKDISGVVILNNSEYIKEIPNSCIDLANELKIPLFKMPWDIKLIDVTKEISSYIMERNLIENKERELIKELLFMKDISKLKICKLTKHCGFNTEGLYFVSIFKIANSLPNNIKEEYVSNYIKMKLTQQNISYVLDKYDKNIICILKYEENLDQLKYVLKKINEDINTYVKSSLSIGGVYKSIFDVKESYQEAIHVLDFYKYINNDIEFIDYEDIGFYKMIFDFKDIEKLKQYRDKNLNKLVKHDENKSAELLDTLKVYLFNNCNLVNTSKALYIHRNTLIYRVNKIKSVLDNALDDPMKKNELMNSIMINEYLNFLENK
ncbi:PucR family transcriptional regulator [Clostridium sp.]|uniref:PucR family transcriptional regulator n=1 Tax=Clostridium sp. TaxID=1506 RepID=UPI003F2DFB1C